MIGQNIENNQGIGIFQNQGQTQYKQGIGRRWQTYERIGLTGINIEIGQTVTRPQGDDETQIRQNRNGSSGILALLQQPKHYVTRNDSAGNHICQGIQLQTQFSRHFEQSGEKAIEKIQKNTQTHKIESHFKIQFSHKNHGNTTAKKIEQRNYVGNVFFNLHRWVD